LGTIQSGAPDVEMAHRAGALALIDGAQARPPENRRAGPLDADFYAFSGHKVFGRRAPASSTAKPAC